MNVLITLTDLRDPGGITSYFNSLRNKFNVNTIYFFTGRRQGEKGALLRIQRFIADYLRFIRCLRTEKVDVVHLNPYMDFRASLREGIFVLLAKYMKKKVVVFFHGADRSFQTAIERRWQKIFKFFFGRSDCIITLSHEMEKTLKAWGLAMPMYHEVTIIEDNFLAEFDLQRALEKRQSSDKLRVLFLSRIIKNKGMYEAIEAVSLLQAKYPMLELVIAGDGDELSNVKSLVHDRNITNVKFVGYVRGKEKRQIIESAHIFCFPTSFGEGMPTAVVEAMAFGLPVLTRPVSGLADFFEDGKHGFITSSLQPQVFAGFIDKLITDRDLYREISLFNYQYAQSHFLASSATLRLEEIYNKVLEAI